MLLKQILKEMISVELLSSKMIMTVSSIILLIYTGQILLVFTQTWTMRDDALQISRTKFLDVTERPAAMYKVYLERFGKSYGNKEMEERFVIFKESLKEIHYLNEVSGAIHGLTKNSDVSKDEMFANSPRLRRSCSGIEKFCMGEKDRDHFYYDLCNDLHLGEQRPESYDWRNHGVGGAVLDQKQYNDGWAFGIVGVMESKAAIRNLEKGVTRSIQELIDCNEYTNGSLSGHVKRLLKWLCDARWPVVTEKQYRLVNRNCTLPKNSAGMRIKQYCQLCRVSTQNIVRFVYFHGPVLAVVNASPWRHYIDGVLQHACNRSSDNNYDHVVQIVGYDLKADVPHFIIRNSWGEDFGDRGSIKLAMEGNVCGITDEISLLDVYF